MSVERSSSEPTSPSDGSFVPSASLSPMLLVRRVSATLVDVVLTVTPVVVICYAMAKIFLVIGENLLMSTGLYVPPYPEGEITGEPGPDPFANSANLLLFASLCGIAVVVISVLLWRRGTSPGKKLFGLYVVDAGTGVPVDFGRMFLRESVCKSICIALPAGLLISFGLDDGVSTALPVVVSFAMLVVLPKRATPWDLMTRTTVVRRALVVSFP